MPYSIIPGGTPSNTLDRVPLTDLQAVPDTKRKRLWLDPEAFLRVVHAPTLATWALTQAARRHPALAARSKRGRPPVYSDQVVLLLALIQVAWHMSYADLIDYVRARVALATFLGFGLETTNQPRVICASQYWERRRALGVWPFLFFFIGMVSQLVRRGVIAGRELVLDSTIVGAIFQADPDAGWSFPKRWHARTWGFKVHTVLCSWSSLPVMFVVTPANRHDSLWAIPLLAATVVCYGFQVLLVHADAAYFSTAILAFIHLGLGAHANIDYNMRRVGKKAIATLPFLRYWRWQHTARWGIERHFAWAKRYFALASSQARGWTAMMQHTALVYTTMLGVALAAERYGRPDLRLSRKGVLAIQVQ